MKCKYLLIATLIIIIATFDSNAQIDVKYKRLGDESFNDKNYYSASVYYSKALTPYSSSNSVFVPFRSNSRKIISKPNSELLADLYYKQAESYRLLNDFSNAKEAYELYFSTYSIAFPLARLWYGITLRSLSDIDKAETQLKLFLKNYTNKDKNFVLATREINNCNYIRNQKVAKVKSKVEKIINVQNKEGSNYALIPLENHQFVYSHLVLANGKDPKTNYISSINHKKSTDSNDIKFVIKDIGNIQVGSVSISANRLQMYFTGWENSSAVNNNLSIYQTKRKTENDNWEKPEKCITAINADGYNSKDPFLTVDGKFLIFSSNRPKGLGGYDLWISNVEDSKTRKSSLNLGSIINTPDDEVSPYYNESENSLYFSSNGNLGMGGLDVFTSKGSLSDLQFSKPSNLGIAVNSVKDDIYFTKTTEQYFVTSDRNSSCCLELYKIQPSKRKLYVKVKDLSSKQIIQDPFILLTGVDSMSKGKSPVYKVESQAYFYDINDFERLAIKVQKDGYKEANIDLQLDHDEDEYTAEILLDKEVVIAKNENPEITIEKVNRKLLDSVRSKSTFTAIVYFNFDASEIRNVEFEVLNKSILKLKQDPALKIIVYSYSDCLGTEEYNLKLSARRSQSVFNYFQQHGIAANRIDTKFFGKEHLIKGCSEQNYNESEQFANRRSEIFLIK